MNSGQYPVQMTRKPMQERGLKGVKNPKTPLGEPATGPSKSLRLQYLLLQTDIRGTQRVVSVKYLFGEANIA